MYDATGDIYLVKEMLGHKEVKTTQAYLGVSYAKAQAASRAIELSSSKISVLLHSMKNISTGDLLTELQARGVDVSSAIDQLRAERKPKIVAIAGGKVIAFQRRNNKGKGRAWGFGGR